MLVYAEFQHVSKIRRDAYLFCNHESVEIKVKFTVW